MLGWERLLVQAGERTQFAKALQQDPREARLDLDLCFARKATETLHKRALGLEQLESWLEGQDLSLEVLTEQELVK